MYHLDWVEQVKRPSIMKLDDKSKFYKLKEANQAFRDGDYTAAMTAYQDLLDSNGSLEKHIKFNFFIAQKNHEHIQAEVAAAAAKKNSNDSSEIKTIQENKKHKFSTPNKYIKSVTDSPKEIFNTKLKIAVVLHVYHADVVELCLESIDHVPFDYDLIVTTPLPRDNESIKLIEKSHPKAKIFFFPNAGRDIGPFVQIWSIVKKYDICCKVHTKKGVSDYIDSWRDLCVEGILHSPSQIKNIVQSFEKDKKLAIAGPELLYGSYEALIGNNRKNVIDLFEKLNIKPAPNEHNGFFMGTMFWFRVSSFGFMSKLQSIEFTPEAAQKDGMVEHAIERIFGSKLLKDQNILLTRINDKHIFSAKIVKCDYKSSINTFHKHFDLVNYSHHNIKNIAGHIHTNGEFDRSMSGWLALKGNETPREAIIMIDDTVEIDILCDKYRGDLERHKINKGIHAFQVSIPFEYMDGREHKFTLIDKFTGKTVSSISKVKDRISDIDVVRSYSVWNEAREKEFLKNLAKQCPDAPKNVLATVIMPTYNRADKIATAVNSVLMQSFQNFELIIIDDGSSDRTSDLIKKCYRDERINFIEGENYGVSHARNVGLKKAKGDYIFFLDSDNSWDVNFLSNMIRFISANQIDAAYCGLSAFNDQNKKTHYKGCDFAWKECLLSNYVDLNTFGFKRTGINPPPLFDESLKRLVDWDYILKYAQYRSISYAPFLGVNYYDGDTARITNTVYRSSDELNVIITSIKDKFNTFIRGMDDLEYTAENLYRKKIIFPLKKDSPTVTTIITTYNHEAYISEAIESVLCQSGNFRHKIIISDDGSTDNTRDIIKKYSDLYPKVIINLSSENNVGLSANMKRCIDASTSRYIAICEGDDFWTDSRKLAKTVEFMEKNKDHSMVFSQILVMNLMKDRFETLPRQENLKTTSVSSLDFVNEPTMNLIGNFSCCLFRAVALKAMPDFMYETRLNEIAVAFHFDKYGSIGFIKKIMSVYRQHANGLWTGSDKVAQLQSGLTARRMAQMAAADKYKSSIEEIIQSRYIAPLSELGFTQ